MEAVLCHRWAVALDCLSLRSELSVAAHLVPYWILAGFVDLVSGVSQNPHLNDETYCTVHSSLRLRDTEVTA